MPYLVTIGLEVHCQVKTRTKMFCACETSFGEEPNTRTCPVCLGLPGALPVLNRHAIEKTLLAGLLLDCGSPEISRWDRKSYFYPDMPKNFQTTQMDFPLCIGGEVPLYDFCYPTDVRKNIPRPGHRARLNRIHLEEDVAKSTHLGTSSLIDFNRAGTPLMEIVSEPDLESAEEAMAYIRSLQMILQQGGIADADMEKGQLRVDVNISLRRKKEDPYGAKIELKNLNSISAIRRAIQFEIQRQSEELDAGIPQIQSTRRWDDDRGESQLLRTKEDAHDYRYFPCPDLLPVVTAPLLEKVRSMLVERPHERAMRYETSYGITPYDASVLSSDLPLANYFEETVRADLSQMAVPHTAEPTPKQIANFILNVGQGIAKNHETTIPASGVPPLSSKFATALTSSGQLSSNQARDVFEKFIELPFTSHTQLFYGLGYQPTNVDELDALCDQVIAANPDKVAEIKGGNEKLLNWLTGQVMKASSSKPNPKQVTDLLKGKLS